MALPAMRTKPMKAVMKKKGVSKIARGRYAKALVLRGSKEKTSGGLKRDGLMKNKRGKIVSKKASAEAKKRFQNSKAKSWVAAISKARKELRLTGFVAINGKTATGTTVEQSQLETILRSKIDRSD